MPGFHELGGHELRAVRGQLQVLQAASARAGANLLHLPHERPRQRLGMLFGRLAREPADVFQYQLRFERAVDHCGRLGRLYRRLILRNGSVVSRRGFPLQLTVAQRAGTILPRGDECAEHEHE